jgi:hypothetical protein
MINQSDYHGLITIASELVQSLVSCIHGQKVSPTYLASICQRLATLKGASRYNAAKGYPASPAIPHHPITGPTLSRPLHELNRPASAQLGHYPPQTFNQNDGNDKELDFVILKQDLSSRDPQMTHKQALLLQALRQRLVKAPMSRKIVLQDFAKHDMLKLNSESVRKFMPYYIMLCSLFLVECRGLHASIRRRNPPRAALKTHERHGFGLFWSGIPS